MGRYKVAPGYKVDRLLKKGDEVAGFTVLDVPRPRLVLFGHGKPATYGPSERMGF
jgi:hypothetical protein